MSPAVKRLARISFWVVFLSAAGVAARQIWVKADPLRNHPVIATWWLNHNFGKLSSTNREAAVRAWVELERCYLTKWSAYDWVVWRIKEDIWKPHDPPIHFGLVRGGNRFTGVLDPRTTQCRTVTEALMAIVYQEPGWRTPLQGDWRKWWDANWTHFPNRARLALPSGPEDPNARPRR
jgi:hypothetical protein